MAKTNNNNTTMFLNMFLMLSLLLIITMVESRSILGVASKRAESSPVCDFVYGVRSGDTCFDIAEDFKLTTELFDSINPNLNCTGLFVGQWICVDGTVN